MKIEKSNYLNSLDPYAFAEIDKARKEAEKKYPKDILDFGVGDPTEPTPAVAVVEGIKEAVMNPEDGYPSYEGEGRFREAISHWFEKRFSVDLNPEKEITATLGSKQAVFTLPMAFADSGDSVLIPDPGYPPYTTGAKQRNAKPEYLPLREENDFLPKLKEVDRKTAENAKIMWINYPNNPTTKIAPQKFLKEAIDFCEENDIILISDEAYSEMYYEENQKPISLFNIEGGMENGLVIHSLSKRSNMTNYRIGFVVGREEILTPFKEVQTNIHSGQSQILQSAAIGALSDEKHVEEMRKTYREKRRTLLPALEKAGFEKVYSEGTFYLWAKTPESKRSVKVVKRMLDNIGINATPGEVLCKTNDDGKNFVRFALVPPSKKIEEAAERLKKKDTFE